MKFRKYIPALLDNLTWILLLGVIILFAALSDRFLTPTNVWNILVHGAVLGILVIGQSFTLVTGNFDLSMESTLGLAAFAGAWIVTAFGPPAGVLAIPALLLVGLAIGWLNGQLITRLKMNNFIVTLAMLIILRGLVVGFSEGETVARLPSWFMALGHDKIGAIPVSVILLLTAFAVAHIVMRNHPFGRDLYAVGGNREAALASGIDPDARVRHVYLLSGLLAAFAGLVMAGRLGAVVPRLGEGMIFEVFAAAVIGGISLQGGRGTMIGALGGVLLLSAIDSGLSLMRVSNFWIDTVRGVVILVAMLVDAQKVRYSEPVAPAAAIAPATAPAGD